MRDALQVKKGTMTAERWGTKHGANLTEFSDEALEAGDPELAITILETAVQHSKGSERAHYYLGVMYGKFGFVVQGIEQLKTAKELTEESLDYTPNVEATKHVQRQLALITARLRELEDKPH